MQHQIRQTPGGFAALALHLLGEGGDEGSREGALREQIPEQVRDSEGGDKGVELPARAEERSEDLLSDEPEDATREHRPADDARRPGESARAR